MIPKWVFRRLGFSLESADEENTSAMPRVNELLNIHPKNIEEALFKVNLALTHKANLDVGFKPNGNLANVFIKMDTLNAGTMVDNLVIWFRYVKNLHIMTQMVGSEMKLENYDGSMEDWLISNQGRELNLEELLATLQNYHFELTQLDKVLNDASRRNLMNLTGASMVSDINTITNIYLER